MFVPRFLSRRLSIMKLELFLTMEALKWIQKYNTLQINAIGKLATGDSQTPSLVTHH
jgi:hypothetical protein